MNKTLCGCGAKNGEEVDGWEFDVDTLEGFMEIIQQYGSVHLNFWGDENVDLWLRREYE
jgi:hypothetical protein